MESTSHISKLQWLVPILLFIASFVWVIFLKHDNPEIVELTRNQYVGDKLEYIDIINERRSEAGMPDIDKEKFEEVYERKLAEIQDKYPISAYFARKQRIKKHQSKDAEELESKKEKEEPKASNNDEQQLEEVKSKKQKKDKKEE